MRAPKARIQPEPIVVHVGRRLVQNTKALPFIQIIACLLALLQSFPEKVPFVKDQQDILPIRRKVVYYPIYLGAFDGQVTVQIDTLHKVPHVGPVDQDIRGCGPFLQKGFEIV